MHRKHLDAEREAHLSADGSVPRAREVAVAADQDRDDVLEHVGVLRQVRAGGCEVEADEEDDHCGVDVQDDGDTVELRPRLLNLRVSRLKVRNLLEDGAHEDVDDGHHEGSAVRQHRLSQSLRRPGLTVLGRVSGIDIRELDVEEVQRVCRGS